MLECYAAGFALPNVDASDGLKDPAPIRVVITADIPGQSDAVSLRTSIGTDLIRVAWVPDCDGPIAVRLYQACVAHALAHLRFSRPSTPIGSRGALRIALASLIEDARVERLMMREYPGLHDLWGAFHSASAGYGPQTFASLAARLARALHDPGYNDPNDWVCKGRRLVDEIADRHEDIGAHQEVADILAVDLAQMRVQFDALSYSVEPRYRDDNTYLWAVESEPAHARLERAPDADHRATAQSDMADSQASHENPPTDGALRSYRYPEWHARVGLLFEDWACVYDREQTSAHDSVQLLEATDPSHRLRCRQRPTTPFRGRLEGDELDLAAVIDHGIARRTGVSGDGRIFEQRRRTPPSVSLLLLLDFSASTNDNTTEGTTTVLDVEKAAAAKLALILEPTRARIAVHGFCSNGRHDVRYTRIKDFDEPFGEAQHSRLHAQRGAFSTRVGPALRHAAKQFDNEQSDARLLMLVTDGQPRDVDVHDSTHLIEDARHAVSAVSSLGIQPFCCALDRDAGKYVRTIFGADRYLILDGARDLAWQIGKVLESLR
ncbi:nitric oxide reductase activation protein NorD [Paraburkholderia sp. SIMBA_030]|uniref:nitric oxide reductase activation protein NorD n=1 Tax=Paraburkholderia sp. SIMBA_030 TaxID=3085773 RepID=UPI003979119D